MPWLLNKPAQMKMPLNMGGIFFALHLGCDKDPL
jgi:hypothetical protein